MQTLVFFHYNPIELFPPALNMIRFLARDGHIRIQVYTTHPPKHIALFRTDDIPGVDILRVGKDNSGLPLLMRLFTYCWFHLVALVHVLTRRADVVMYIESFSAVIPLLLKQYLRRSVGLFIHYHEYMGPADYDRSVMLRFIHRWEKRMYAKASWISHTNEDRMTMFLHDLGQEKGTLQTRLMPNYPPASWAQHSKKSSWNPGNPFRFVYVGAVGLQGLYFREIFHWISTMEGMCTLDIYSNQPVEELKALAGRDTMPYIRFNPPVSYFRLPEVLSAYDVGLILYKDETVNFRFNAPNKLFEYLNIGLDVWFPGHMLGIQPYIQQDCHPMVLPVDFDALDKSTITALYQGKEPRFSPVQYQAETVYTPLLTAIQQYTA